MPNVAICFPYDETLQHAPKSHSLPGRQQRQGLGHCAGARRSRRWALVNHQISPAICCWTQNGLVIFGINSRTLTIFDPSKIGFPYPCERLLTIQCRLFWSILTNLGQMQTSTLWTFEHNLPGNMSAYYQKKTLPGSRMHDLQSGNISTSLHLFNHVQASGLCTWTLTKFGHRSLSTLAAAGGGARAVWICVSFEMCHNPTKHNIVGHPNIAEYNMIILPILNLPGNRVVYHAIQWFPVALREATWPAVGEELEAKSNGLWHRATVAEIGQRWLGMAWD